MRKSSRSWGRNRHKSRKHKAVKKKYGPKKPEKFFGKA